MITDHEFVGKREWGLFPSADKPCQQRHSKRGVVCGMPQGQHASRCRAALTIAGRYFRCDLMPPHGGSHRNAAADAIWDGSAA